MAASSASTNHPWLSFTRADPAWAGDHFGFDEPVVNSYPLCEIQGESRGMSTRPLIALLAAVLPLLAGCSGDNLPTTHPVTGVVMYKGAPVEGASVTLVPSDSEGRSAGATTDAEGKFAVKTYLGPKHQPHGALPGDYTITVSKMEAREIPEGMKPEEVTAVFREMGPPKNLLPKQYRAPNTSSLKVTVQPKLEPLTLNLED